MKKAAIIIITMLMILHAAACKKTKKPSQKPEIPPVVEFNTIKELVDHHIKCINNGYINAALKSLLQRDLYIKEIFKQVDKSKDKSDYAADVHWRTFHAGKRLWGINKAIKKYKGRIIKLEHIGKPKQVIKFKGFSFIRRLKVFLLVQKGAKQFSVEDNNYFGIIVKRKNKYQLLHIYWD